MITDLCVGGFGRDQTGHNLSPILTLSLPVARFVQQ